MVDTESAKALLQSFDDNEREKARLKCLAREGAGDWLTAFPSKSLGLHLRRMEFVTAARYRLGLPVFQVGAECPILCLFGSNHKNHTYMSWIMKIILKE